MNYTFFIPAAIAQIFKPIAELIPIGIPSKEGKTETGIYPVIVETKIKKVFNVTKYNIGWYSRICRINSVYKQNR